MEKVTISKKLMQRKTKTKTWTRMTRLFILRAEDWPAGSELFAAIPQVVVLWALRSPVRDLVKTFICRLQLQEEKKKNQIMASPTAAETDLFRKSSLLGWKDTSNIDYLLYSSSLKKVEISWPGCCWSHYILLNSLLLGQVSFLRAFPCESE